jgi:DNA polymerase III subunit gamma/tau
VRTLRNAVERGKVHHAYLFVGSRGTGKTSMAKILAACLNCEHGPTIEPCGKCDSCLSIARATSLDVIEMDAASNNSVDDIRELRESVAYAPVSGRRKIYILDEAHMLSTAAWNAFLKTLEEPPPNTVFVLATTEANKVPATVVDRCHRFDFHRPTVEQIAEVLRRSAQSEAIEIPPPAVAAIARSATGSFRDALGTLEQLVTYSGNQISLDDVLAVLGVADGRLLAEAVDAVAGGDARAALGVLERCAAQGRDAGSFAGDLEARLRELLIVQTLGEVPAELALTPEADAGLAEQAAAVPHTLVVRLLELLGEAMEAIRAGADPRTRLELALVKAAKPEADSSLRALLARIERLEQGGSVVSAVAAQREVPAPEAPASAPEVRATAPEPPSSTPEVRAPGVPEVPESAPEVPASAPEASTGGGVAAPVAEVQPPVASMPTPGESQAVGPVAGLQSEPVAPAVSAETAAEPLAGAVAATVVHDLDSICLLWPAVVDLVRSENARLGAAILEVRPVELSGDELTLAFGSAFLKKQAEAPADRMMVGEALTALSGSRWKLSYELREPLPVERDADSEEFSEERSLARFMQEFDAEDITAEVDGAVPTATSNEKGA